MIEISAARRGGPRLGRARRTSRRADTTAYAKDRPLDGRDPFQALYNRIANDLVRARDKRKPQELAEPCARWRGCASRPSMAPDPYAAYLATDEEGTLARRAAAGGGRPDDRPHRRDPRARPHVRGHAQRVLRDFYARMDKPYDDWRAYSYEEQVALDSINRNSTLKKILGGIAVLGGILMDPRDDDHGHQGRPDPRRHRRGATRASRTGKEAGIHKAALSELADSFEGEVTPLLVDVDGKVVQLTGLGRGAVHEVARAAAGDRRDRRAAARRHQPPPDGAGGGRAALSVPAAR